MHLICMCVPTQEIKKFLILPRDSCNQPTAHELATAKIVSHIFSIAHECADVNTVRTAINDSKLRD